MPPQPPPNQGPWVRLHNLEPNWVDELVERLLPSLGWQGPLPIAKSVQENGKKAYVLLCRSDGQAKALYSILAGGEQPQFPYAVSWLEVNSPKPKAFSKYPPPSQIDCKKHTGDSCCSFKTSINEGKGSGCLNEECCPFRHPRGCNEVCESWAMNQACGAGSKCKKLHPAQVLIDSIRTKFPAPTSQPATPTLAPGPHGGLVCGTCSGSGVQISHLSNGPGVTPEVHKQCPACKGQGKKPDRSNPERSKPEPSNNHNNKGKSDGGRNKPKPAGPPQNNPRPSNPGASIPQSSNLGSSPQAPNANKSAAIKPICLNPACTKPPTACRHGPARESAIKRLLEPLELLNKPPNKYATEQLQKEMQVKLFGLQLEDRLKDEIKSEVMALSQGVKDIEKFKPKLDVPLASCAAAARKLGEGICKELLVWHDVEQGLDKMTFDTMISRLAHIDFGEAPERKKLVPELMSLLDVLRSYGNVYVHIKDSNRPPPPMPEEKYDRLLIFTAYAYHACKHFLHLV